MGTTEIHITCAQIVSKSFHCQQTHYYIETLGTGWTSNHFYEECYYTRKVRIIGHGGLDGWHIANSTTLETGDPDFAIKQRSGATSVVIVRFGRLGPNGHTGTKGKRYLECRSVLRKGTNDPRS